MKAMRNSWKSSRATEPVGVVISSMSSCSDSQSTARPASAANVESPMITITRRPEIPTRMKSTSFARAAGRP